jgi:hypothetical protein
LAARRTDIERLKGNGLVVGESNRLRIPEQHTLIANEVAAALL